MQGVLVVGKGCTTVNPATCSFTVGSSGGGSGASSRVHVSYGLNSDSFKGHFIKGNLHHKTTGDGGTGGLVVAVLRGLAMASIVFFFES